WRREEARDEDQTRDVPVEGLELSLDRLGSAGEDHNKVEGLGCVGEQMLQTGHRHREEIARRQDDGAALDLLQCVHSAASAWCRTKAGRHRRRYRFSIICAVTRISHTDRKSVV